MDSLRGHAMVRVPIGIALLLLAVEAQASAIERMTWLAGCWKGGSGERVVEEQWMLPRGGLMLGMGRTVNGTKAATFEQMRIHEDGDRLVFTSKPADKPEDSFRALDAVDDGIVFENLEHGFPQRIIYRRAGDGSLAARIEGKRGDKVVGIDFPMQRVACAG
jgi:Domain of unknown function (DUF6265)